MKGVANCEATIKHLLEENVATNENKGDEDLENRRSNSESKDRLHDDKTFLSMLTRLETYFPSKKWVLDIIKF